jgi:hypothetical protein
MMRIVFALCVAALCFATAAEAQNNFKLKGFFTRADVNKACKAAGGVPNGNNDVYGCTKDNCDGKGGYCGVQCDKGTGECKGTTPTRTAGSNSDPFQVLRPERADQFAIPEPIGRGMADNTDRPGSDFQSFHARSCAPRLSGQPRRLLFQESRAAGPQQQLLRLGRQQRQPHDAGSAARDNGKNLLPRARRRPIPFPMAHKRRVPKGRRPASRRKQLRKRAALGLGARASRPLLRPILNSRH